MAGDQNDETIDQRRDARVELTDALIRKIPAPPRARKPRDGRRPVAYTITRDSVAPGLQVRVTSTGARSFTFERRIKGRSRRLTIGSYPAWSLSKAREEARRLLREVEAGNDPASERLDKWARVVDEPTLGALFDWWLGSGHLAPTTLRVHRSLIKAHLKSIRSSRPSELSRPRLSELRDAIIANAAKNAQRGSFDGAPGARTASAAIKLLRAVVARAARDGRLPVEVTLPTITLPPAVTRERVADINEVTAILRAIDRQPDPVWRAFFRLLIATGCRKDELLKRRWTDVVQHVDGTFLVLPRTKNGTSRTVPLSEFAIRALDEVPRYGEFIFVGRTDGPRTAPWPTWTKILNDAGVHGLTLHDIRRTTGTISRRLSIPAEDVAHLLGHQDPAMARIYQRLSGSDSIPAVRAVGGFLEDRREVIDFANFWRQVALGIEQARAALSGLTGPGQGPQPQMEG